MAIFMLSQGEPSISCEI